MRRATTSRDGMQYETRAGECQVLGEEYQTAIFQVIRLCRDALSYVDVDLVADAGYIRTAILCAEQRCPTQGH